MTGTLAGVLILSGIVLFSLDDSLELLPMDGLGPCSYKFLDFPRFSGPLKPPFRQRETLPSPLLWMLQGICTQALTSTECIVTESFLDRRVARARTLHLTAGMTRIVLILTAVPLAAVLELVLNTLLERATERQGLLKSLVLVVSAALLAALAPAPGSAAATSSGDSCAAIECSLTVDREQFDELWTSRQTNSVRLVRQTSIPISARPRLDPDGPVVVDGWGRKRPPKASPGEAADRSLETLRP